MKRNNKRTPLVSAPRYEGGSKHDTPTKLAAVKHVKTLLAQGLAKWAALTKVAQEHGVAPVTMSNWLNKYKDLTVRIQKSNGAVANTNNHTNGFSIQSVNLRTTEGTHIQLTPADINRIASLASTIC